MTPKGFKALCADIRLNWTAGDGLVAMLLSRRGGECARLCAGTARNDGLLPSTCLLWDGDELLYDGPLASDELKELLTCLHVCGASFTTAQEMQKAPRCSKCYAPGGPCKGAPCPAGGVPC